MTPKLSFRDVEKLSAYLDGQLKPSEIARLEARLQTDPELASVLRDLRQARGILRQLPQRRAPRNFTLTPKMVGLKPPMPRAYPVFRLATVLATLLLFFTFATNFMAPRMERAAVPYGIGGYGGGGDAAEPQLSMEVAPAEESESAAPAAEAPMIEEPAAPAEPAEPAMEAPPAPESPAPAEGEPAAPEMPAPAPTEEAATVEDSARMEPTMQPPAGENLQQAAPEEPYTQKTTPDETLPTQAPARPRPPFGSTLQIVLTGIAIISALIAFTLRFITIRKWREKTK